LELGPDAVLLDVGCGAGLALQAYAPRCKDVAGVDAAAGLLAIAKVRLPSKELPRAPMTKLPWPDDTFTHVTGVNSFVYADDGALAEAHRVLQPGGLLGVGFWKDPMDFGWALGALGAALAPYVGAEEAQTLLRMSDPETATQLLADAGFEIVRSGEVIGVSEFADVDIAYRALASTGMIYPLLQAGKESSLRAQCEATLRSVYRTDTGVRMAANFGWVVAARS
jgi:ubiquinone/menaquinone biosynthesis C-methylase UbiE